MLDYLLIEVTVVGVLHDDAQRLVLLLHEHILVGYDIWMFDTGQDSDFVNSIRTLLLGQNVYPDLLQGVVETISMAADMVDARVGTRAELADNFELIELINLT